MKKNVGKGQNAEFASETNVQEVREQNRQSQLGKSQKSQQAEFASETDVAEVREQNRQAEMKKQQASGSRANGSFNQTK
ncbi:gamma-type small acid-soluble spore protein [Bacillus sp. FJAT-22090]|uniref:gamma-type small acid-soluble spore protein n=1 Tax=Bacillus sp. FJAT-22090 TaxID=1581038 RepID=UPI0021B34B4C|nr:gamma-type small acid-soluble spore protein [Bacillus sp. FJAT-22090]